MYQFHFFISHYFEHIDDQVDLVSRWIVHILKSVIDLIFRISYEGIEHLIESRQYFTGGIFFAFAENVLVEHFFPRLQNLEHIISVYEEILKFLKVHVLCFVITELILVNLLQHSHDLVVVKNNVFSITLEIG